MMLKQFLLILAGLFVFLYLIGMILASHAITSDDFTKIKPPPEILTPPTSNPFSGIQVVSVPGSDTISLNRSARPAFINFWATWCRPCIAEMPAIEKLYQAQKGHSDFYIVSTSGREEQIESFVRQKGYSFPVYRLISTPRTDSLIRKIPLTLLAQGSSLWIRHNGSANWDSEAVHQLIEELADNQ